MKSSFFLLLVFLAIFLLSGCTTPERDTYVFSWTPPEDQGMNGTLLYGMGEYIVDYYPEIDAVIIIRHNHSVSEWYFNANWGNSVPHNLFSCTKSITSALVGIAIDKNLFKLEDHVVDFFSDKEFENITEWKQNITVKHLMQMFNSDDWVKYVLDKPMAAEPGTKFDYNTGNSHLLSAIIQQTSNMTTLEFAQKYLFDPLDIKPGAWSSSPSGVVCGGSDLGLTPRDMGKIGFLYLNNGSWFGAQVIPKEWVLKSTRIMSGDTNISAEWYYGYQWWIEPDVYGHFMFTAIGTRGQWIAVFPDLDLVVVFTGSYYDKPWFFEILENYILAAITE
jgi:CubicO group peptidase (beta-lactamase class C family)